MSVKLLQVYAVGGGGGGGDALQKKNPSNSHTMKMADAFSVPNQMIKIFLRL